MCKSPLHPFLVALPKCEHHMHLEGSLSPEMAFALSAKNSIPLPSATSNPAYVSAATLQARYDAGFASLDDFLGYYYDAVRVLVSAADFEALATAYFARAADAGVRHAEVFFDPQSHTARGVPLDTVIAGFASAARRLPPGMTAVLIPCLLRHLPLADAEATFAALRPHFAAADGPLGGLGLCSSETQFPPVMWAAIFADAKKAGIRRTVHAGEEGPAKFVAGALDDLAAQRIDHGVHAAEDEALLERLAGEGVLLTVCPLSNVVLKGFKRVADLPIRKLLDKGVRFSINSDDPAYFGGYIQENYCAVQEAFGLSLEEWAIIARNAVEGSWVEDRRKAEMLAEVETVCVEWKGKLVA